jgi:serine/threonine protein kinase
MNEKEKQQIVSEVNILRELRHPSIVRYYDRIVDKRNLKIYIIMEFCQGGDLQKVIKRCLQSGDFISEEFIWKIFAQIVCGLNFCHRRQETTQINRGDTNTSTSEGP